MLDEFVSTSDALLDIVTDLTDEEWSTIAESPAGHVPIRLVVQHALWDCWVHERDIAVPLGIAPAAEVGRVELVLAIRRGHRPSARTRSGDDTGDRRGRRGN